MLLTALVALLEEYINCTLPYIRISLKSDLVNEVIESIIHKSLDSAMGQLTQFIKVFTDTTSQCQQSLTHSWPNSLGPLAELLNCIILTV